MDEWMDGLMGSSEQVNGFLSRDYTKGLSIRNRSIPGLYAEQPGGKVVESSTERATSNPSSSIFPKLRLAF